MTDHDTQGLNRAIRAYADAETTEQRQEAFEHVQQWLVDDETPADADLAAHAEQILRDRGVW